MGSSTIPASSGGAPLKYASLTVAAGTTSATPGTQNGFIVFSPAVDLPAGSYAMIANRGGQQVAFGSFAQVGVGTAWLGAGTTTDATTLNWYIPASWTFRANPHGVTVGTVAFLGPFNNVFYKGSSANTLNYYSTDGINWTQQTSDAFTLHHGMTYGNSLYVQVGTNATTTANSIQTSTNGVTWTAQASTYGSAAGATAFSVASITGRFIVIGHNATAQSISTSTNGSTWTAVTNPTSWQTGLGGGTAYSAVTSNGTNLFVLINGDGASASSNFYTSTDGITWTLRTAPLLTQVGSLADGQLGFTNSLFYLINPFVAQGTIYTSTNGVTWTVNTVTQSPSNANQMTFGEGNYVVNTTNNSGLLFVSTDLVTWKTITTNSGGTTKQVGYNGSIWVVVGNGAANGASSTTVHGTVTNFNTLLIEGQAKTATL
jgi:hypothetical protein